MRNLTYKEARQLPKITQLLSSRIMVRTQPVGSRDYGLQNYGLLSLTIM